jgi:hypothetical protein
MKRLLFIACMLFSISVKAQKLCADSLKDVKKTFLLTKDSISLYTIGSEGNKSMCLYNAKNTSVRTVLQLEPGVMSTSEVTSGQFVIIGPYKGPGKQNITFTTTTIYFSYDE